MKKVACIYFLFFLFVNRHVQAQINDAQLWENINLEKKITQRILIRINQEGRITENMTRPSFNYFDVGVSYKINKHIHATLAYVWTEKRQLTEFWSTRYQAYGDLTFRKKIRNFQINYRLMFLGQVKDYYTSKNGKNIDYYIRNKITIKYDKNFKYSPYIAAELYYLENKADVHLQYHFNRIRYFAGVFYRPDLVDEFETYYLIEQQFNVNNTPGGNNYNNLNPLHNWVIGIGYTHTF